MSNISMDPRYLRNPDLFARMAAPILASKPTRGADGKWHWGGITTEKRFDNATSDSAIDIEARRGSIVFHRRFSGANMNPESRETLRMNRAKVEHMKKERQIMLRIAAQHQLEQERSTMAQEEELSKARELVEAEEAEQLTREAEEANNLARMNRHNVIRPDAFRKIARKQRKKSTTTTNFQNTTTMYSPGLHQTRNKKNTVRKFHGRTSSDFLDVQSALSRINRR